MEVWYASYGVKWDELMKNGLKRKRGRSVASSFLPSEDCDCQLVSNARGCELTISHGRVAIFEDGDVGYRVSVVDCNVD